jgi:tetratricopeptide (TPR) repeat protein
MRHFMAGRFADAEQCAERVLSLAPRAQDAIVGQLVTVQVCAVRKEAGDLPGLEAVVQEMIRTHPEVTAWRCFLAYLYAEAGQLEQARSQLEPLISELDAFPSDILWLNSLALLADVAAVLDHTRSAQLLYKQLLPHRERAVIGLGGLWFGPVDHHLALLARTTRDFEAAEGHFDVAAAMARRIDARPWLGHTLREHAAALIMRHQPGDRERALTLLIRSDRGGTSDDRPAPRGRQSPRPGLTNRGGDLRGSTNARPVAPHAIP